jgi:hypothetical protein
MKTAAGLNLAADYRNRPQKASGVRVSRVFEELFNWCLIPPYHAAQAYAAA